MSAVLVPVPLANVYKTGIPAGIISHVSTRIALIAQNHVLSPENYELWNQKVRQALAPARIFDKFIAQLYDNPDDEDKKTFWETDKYLVTGWIEEAAGAGLYHITRPFSETGDCRGLWDSLSTLYNKSAPLSRFRLYHEMMQLTSNSNNNSQEIIRRGAELLDSVSRISPSIMSSQEVCEEMVICAILERIPKSHPFYVSLLELTKISFSDFSRKVILHESSLHDTDGSLAHASIAYATANANAASTSSLKLQLNQIEDSSTCYFCEYAHRFYECRLFLSAKRACLEKKEARRAAKLSGSSTLTTAPQPHPSKLVSKQVSKKTEKANTVDADDDDDDEIYEDFEFAGQASTARSPTEPFSDKWIPDSGASCHMTPRSDWVFEKVVDRRPVKLANGVIIFSTHRGLCHIVPRIPNAARIMIRNVLLAPELDSNLFSTNRFASGPNQQIVMEGPMTSFFKNTSVISTALMKGNLGYLNVDTVLAIEVEQAFSAASIVTWHRRLGHCNFRAILKSLSTNSVEGLHISDKTVPSDPCIDCANGKLSKAAHTSTPVRTKRPLERVYSDVVGPMNVQGRSGERYVVAFLDDHSRLAKTYKLRTKDGVLDSFMRFKAWAENQMNARIERFDEEGLRKTIRVLRDDKGGEYTSSRFESFCQLHGIDREHTIRASPEQNGVAKCFNRTLLQGVVTILSVKVASLPLARCGGHDCTHL